MPGMGVELLYVVHDWKVDVYSIIPITPSLLPTLAAAVKIRLYHAAQENIFSNETGGFESTTKYELSGTDYFDLSVYQTMPNDIYYTFAQFHLDLLDYVNVVESDEQSSDPDSPPPRLYHDGCVLEYDICESIAPIKFSSIFVEVWSGDETDPAYHWGHHPDNPSPRRIANQLRLELSMDLVSRVRESISQLSLESWTPHFAFYPHRERELNRFFTYLETRYADRISGEFSEFSF